ncbi:TorF family putative porin [Lysobacter arvi]|uniref:TorF family putative porin n=1 Tax=Lysobacter arvi TaxID=3038776 RepID=A0ABU1C9N7_9GAMM|nr:TorF family putative porin [Lysobacter arvi]MDR0181906.1 TorF family putative porin [Lysobacter arvi]
MTSPTLLLHAAVVGACAAFGVVADSHAASFSGNAALTTDYVWRGTTQTQGDPAVQAGLRLAGDRGWYASAWGSSVEFAPELHASSELDFTVGWSGTLGGALALDVNALHYRYPATTTDLDWTELNGTLTWASRYWLSLGWSPEALGSDDAGTYTQLGARFPVGEAFRIEAVAGCYVLDDVHEDRYAHGQLNAIWTVNAASHPIELRVSAHGTDSGAKRIFGDDLAGTRIEAAVQAAF